MMRPWNRLFILVLAAIVGVGCTPDQWARTTHNLLKQNECQDQTKGLDQTHCVKSYDEEYDEYQRQRELYLKERQREVEE